MLGSRISARLLVLTAAFSAIVARAQVVPIIIPGGPCSSLPAKPKFSVKPGAYTAPLSVRLTDQTRGAIVFYTTDGWTPTALSPRYLGPIAITTTTTLQAVAIVPNCSVSGVRSATYTLPTAPPALPSAATLPALPIGQDTFSLRSDEPVGLVFATAIDSRTAQIGDPISFSLAEDLKIGDTIFAPKGTMATGKVILVDRSQIGGSAGEIQFQVDSLDLDGSHLPLHATEALSGPSLPAASTSWVTGALTGGLSVLLTHGKDAQIPAGTPVTATIPAGTVLSPSAGATARMTPVAP